MNSVRLSPNGKYLATTSSNSNDAIIWDMLTGAVVHTFKGHKAPIISLAFSTDGKQLASGSRDKTAKVWDVESGKEIFTLNDHSNVVRAVSFSPDGSRLVTASHDTSAKIWDWREQRFFLN